MAHCPPLRSRPAHHLAALLALLAGASACKPEPEPEPEPEDTDPGERTLRLRFDAFVGEEPVDCVSEYRGLGANGSGNANLRGLTMFLHNIEMLDDRGQGWPVTLDDTPYQRNGQALLDFLPAGDYCVDGDEATNTVITGRVADLPFRGIRFTMGIPFDLNHSDITEMTLPPFNRPELFRGRLSGYWFFKLDMRSVDLLEEWPVWIGSIGCQSDGMGAVTGCLAENLVNWIILEFDPDTMDLRVDLRELLLRSEIDQNASYGDSPTPEGCQSDAADPDCTDLFPAYGLAPSLRPTWIAPVPTSGEDPVDTGSTTGTGSTGDTSTP